MAERQKVLGKDYSDDFRTVTINFLGTDDTLTVNVEALPEAVRKQAICHGLVQKLGDAAAGESGVAAYDAVMTVYERLVAGDWTKVREGVGPRPSIVAEAVCRVLEKAGKVFNRAAKIIEYTGKDSKAKRDGALANAVVKAEFDAIQAERAMERADKSAALAVGASVDSL